MVKKSLDMGKAADVVAQAALEEAYKKAAIDLQSGVKIQEVASKHGITIQEAAAIRRLLNRGVNIDPMGRVTITDEALDQILETRATRRTRRKEEEKPPPDPSTIVDTVVKEEVAKEAEQRAKQIFLLGKSVRDAWLKYCSQKGIPIEQALQMNVNKIIPEALEKAADYDRVKEERDALLKRVEELEAFADPLSRAYKALELWMSLYAYIKLMRKSGLTPSPQAIKKISQKIKDFSIGKSPEISPQEIEETLWE